MEVHSQAQTIFLSSIGEFFFFKVKFDYYSKRVFVNLDSVSLQASKLKTKVSLKISSP